MVKVLIKKLDPSISLPEYETSGASGMDLRAFIKKPIIIKPKTSYLIPTGLSVAFSKEYEIQAEISTLMLDIFERGRSKLGDRAFSTSIVKILEDKCNENLRANGFPDCLVDHENKKDGIEVIKND